MTRGTLGCGYPRLPLRVCGYTRSVLMAAVARHAIAAGGPKRVVTRAVVFGALVMAAGWLGASAASAETVEEVVEEVVDGVKADMVSDSGVAALGTITEPAAELPPAPQVDQTLTANLVGGTVDGVVTPVVRTVEPAVVPVIDAVTPVVAPVVASIEPVIANLVTPLATPVIDAAQPVVTPVLRTVTPAVAPVVHPVLAPVVRAVVPLVAPVIAPVIDAAVPVVGPTAESLLAAGDSAPPTPAVGPGGGRDFAGERDGLRRWATRSADRSTTRAWAPHPATDAESAPAPADSLPLPVHHPRSLWPAPSSSGTSTSGRDMPDRMHSDVVEAAAFAPKVISAVGTSTRVRAAGASENSGSRPAFTPD